MAVLQGEHSLGSISVDEIEKNLFLGSLAAAKDIDTLNRLNITHILTIETCPLPRNILELRHITTKYIQLLDFSKEDILSHFDDTDIFIQDGLSNGAVLVHCYFGISRSATVVIAYIMKKYGLTYPEAFEKVKLKRKVVCPNQGFVSQLKLYKEMGFITDKSNRRYKILRLSAAANQVRREKILPQNFMDLIQPNPGLPQSQPDPNYRCGKCRRVLALESNLILHKDKGKNCTKTYFLEPIAWMNVTQEIQGKLHCPKCKHKVGSFSWIMGSKCPCGVQVAPAFYLVPSKVDYTNVVKNVEMTF